MKHSASSDSMTEVLEPKVVIPCTVNCESDLQKLYIDLCNLIVESRIPRFNEKGYGDGIHCLPLLGRSTHLCDLSKPECQKHQRLIQHLMRAVGSNVFEIEVLVLPDCCRESKLKERIQNREYRLLEKWSMKCIYSKVQSTLVDIPQLLRAVRSFLHFSQLSAWLSSTKGKSPSNVYYWVKSSSEGLSTDFEHEPDEHSFPVCKIAEDAYGSVQVKYPPRTQYVPIIPCSKHPPLHGYPFKSINDSSSLHQNISINSQVVRQLHKTPCDDQLGVLSENGCVSEPAPLLLTPTILKTFTGNKSDGNRILKHSYCPDGLVDASNLSFELKQSKSIDLLSKSQTSYLCNYAETYSNGLSQENVCFDTSQLIRHFRKKKLKIRRINRDALFSRENSTTLKSSDDSKCHHSQVNHLTKNVPSLTSNPYVNLASTNTIVKTCEASLESETYHCRKSEQKKRSSKRKVLDASSSEKSAVIPPKKVCCDKYLSQGYKISLTCLSEIFPQCNGESSQVSCKIPVIPTGINLNFEGDDTKAENYVVHETKTLEPNVSNEADSHLSKCFSVSSTQTCSKSERGNKKSCCKRKFFRKIEVEKDNIGLDKNTTMSSETRACDATYVADSDGKNEFKKIKLIGNCIDNLSCSTSCCTSETSSFCKPVYNPALSYKYSENDYVCREPIFERKSLDLLKYQKSPSAKSKVVHAENISDCGPNFNPSLKTKFKSNVFSNRYELQTSLNENHTSKSKLLSICKEKNRRLEAKLLKRYNKIISMKCRGSSSETTLQNSTESNSQCRRCNRTHLNSSKCSLQERKLNHLAKRLRNVRMALKNFKEEALVNASEPVETTSSAINLLTTESKYRRIAKKKKCKSSKKTFKPASCDISAPSQPDKATNFCEALCSFEKCGCQKPQPKFALPKRISSASTAPVALLLQKPFPAQSCKKETCSIPDRHESETILEPNKIILQNDSQRPFVLNRWVLSSKRSFPFEKSNENLECFPKVISSFPKGRKLLANFEESILKGCLPTLSSVTGFHAEIGASGSFFPGHLTLPANVSFYELGNSHQGTAPYVAHVILGDAEYYLPKKGAVQVTLFNPSETVVKMFVLNYDLTFMPPMCHTFIRQKIYYLPIGSTEESPSSSKWLRFIIHLRFASSKTGKIFLHEDFKIVVLNKSNDDAASEFNQEPRELRSFVSVPRNPTFSNF